MPIVWLNLRSILLQCFALQHLPLAAINPQTFRSDAESEAKAAVKVVASLRPCSSLQPQSIILQARYPPNPSTISSTQPLPPPRTSIIDHYRCDCLLYWARFASACPPSCSESSDHDAASDEKTIAAGVEASKGRGCLKLRRQQKRLEVISPLSRAHTRFFFFSLLFSLSK